MDNSFMELSCQEFAGALASKASVPSGGAAAAYCGAVGVALASMVGNLTTGKPKYAQYEDDIQRILAECADIRVRLLALVDEDARNFAPLAAAYAIPKDDPARQETLEQCTKVALEAPLTMMREICHAIDCLAELQEKGSLLLISDVGCGASLCAGALEAAAMNVFVNTKTLTDRTFAASIDEECDAMLATYAPKARCVAAEVLASLR